MDKNEIEEIVSVCMGTANPEFEKPSEKDWDIIIEKFGTDFGSSYRNFIEVMTKFDFPGELYNVSTGNNNGDDSLVFVYEFEMKEQGWDSDFVPFYGLGNGDFFCLSKCKNSIGKVYFFDHTVGKFFLKFNSFDHWIRDLPNYFSWNKNT